MPEEQSATPRNIPSFGNTRYTAARRALSAEELATALAATTVEDNGCGRLQRLNKYEGTNTKYKCPAVDATCYFATAHIPGGSRYHT